MLGGGLAYVTLPGITLALAFLVATILAPTDAALSLAVVSNPRVPMTLRNSLNVESGLNDGIATPIVTVLIAVVAAEEGAAQGWLAYAVKTIAIALAVAVVLGGGAGWLVLRAREAGWTSPISEQFIVLTVALLSYLGTVSLGGNGFVASFVGGLVFGLVSRRELSVATEYAETTGLFLSYAVWAFRRGPRRNPARARLARLRPGVRRAVAHRRTAVPVALSLIGAGLDRTTVLFVGWFGPRGLASIVFLILAVHGLHLDLAQIVGERPYEAVVWTVLLSVVLHGITAGPLASAYGRRANVGVRPDPDGRDRQRAATPPVRSRLDVGAVLRTALARAGHGVDSRPTEEWRRCGHVSGRAGRRDRGPRGRQRGDLPQRARQRQHPGAGLRRDVLHRRSVVA